MRVILANSAMGFSVAAGQPLLDAALAAGLKVAHGCRSRNCGACRARVIDGAVEYPRGRPLGLSDLEIDAGFVLLCQARAARDLCIEIIEIRTPSEAIIQRLPCRIERAERWSHDVLGVFLRLPSAAGLDFEPGQYVDVLLPCGRRRSFSIASPPHDSRPLELHVRRVAGGVFTDPLFERDGRGSLLSIEGPHGRFVYRPATAQMLLVAGGTGFAPLKSVLRHVLEKGLPRQISCYWGVRSERDLYAHAQLQDLARRSPNFRYHAVLSEPDSGWRGRRGLVHEAVLEDLERLDAHDIYASGPPAMIEALRRDFARFGADPNRLWSDSFDYAPDSIERHLAMAASKS